HGFSKHRPVLPLYTQSDAERTLDRLKTISFNRTISLPGGATVRKRRAGHFLGAASIELHWSETRIVFSGDIGRYDDGVMVDPDPVESADYLLVKSTYGDRRHEGGNPQDALAGIILRTIGRAGTIVIPTFAVGLAQILLFHLHQLKAGGRVP